MNPYNLEDMLEKYWAALEAKQRLARVAGAVFALAVLVAGAAPVASLLHAASPTQSLTYVFGKDGLKASAALNAPPNTVSELKIIAIESEKEAVVASQRGAVGQDGTIRLETTGAVPPTSTTIRLQMTCNVADSKRRQVLSIPLQPPRGMATVPDAVIEGTCAKWAAPGRQTSTSVCELTGHIPGRRRFYPDPY